MSTALKAEAWYVEKCQGEAAFLLHELMRQHILSDDEIRSTWSWADPTIGVHDFQGAVTFYAKIGHRLRGDEP